MDIKSIFNKVNVLVEEAGYHSRINDITALGRFVNNEENKKYRQYDEINELYEQLMMGAGMW